MYMRQDKHTVSGMVALEYEHLTGEDAHWAEGYRHPRKSPMEDKAYELEVRAIACEKVRSINFRQGQKVPIWVALPLWLGRAGSSYRLRKKGEVITSNNSPELPYVNNATCHGR